MKPSGAHTHGPQGGGGLFFAAVVAAAVLGSGAATAVASALVVVAITIAVLAAAAVIGAAGLLIWRARSERPRAVFTARPIPPAPAEVRPHLEESHKRAIEPPRNELHLHFHGLSPAEVAEAIRQANGK